MGAAEVRGAASERLPRELVANLAVAELAAVVGGGELVWAPGEHWASRAG